MFKALIAEVNDYANEAACQLLKFPQSTIEIAKASFLTVNTFHLREKKRGSAVLIGPNLALSAVHVFPCTGSCDGFVRRPHTNEYSEIKNVEFFPGEDVVAITLEQPFAAPFAKVDTTTPLNPKTPILMPSLAQRDVIRSRNGLMLRPEVKIPSESKAANKFILQEQMRSSLMFMRNTEGNSGSSVFSFAGGVITILVGGHKFRADGPAVPDFRRIAQRFDIPILGKE